MATEVGSAYVSIVPSARGFGTSLDRGIGRQVDQSGTRSGKRFGKGFAGGIGTAVAGVGRSIAVIAGPLAVLGGIRVLGDFVADARESARISALTAQAIKSTGGAAGVTAKQVGRLSSAISEKTGIDDEQIQSGANLLLTFRNIRNELGAGNKIFDRANFAITDMSAALGQDTKSSAIQLGKALNDPVKGVTALARVGVQFTDQQRAQITAMTENGNRLGAQKVILNELSKEFGGAAAAMATPGDRLKVTLGNLGESIGAQLIPQIDRFANFMVKRGIPALRQFGTFLQINVVPILRQFGAFIATSVVPALIRLGVFLRANVLPPLQQLGAFVATSVLPRLRQLAGFVSTVLVPVVGRVLVQAFAGLRSAFASIRAVLDRNKTSVNQFSTAFRTLAAFVVTRVLPVLGPLLRFAFTALGKLLANNIRITLIFVRVFARIIGTAIRVAAAIARVVSLFANMGQRIIAATSNFRTLLVSAGKDLILGLVNGIKSVASAPANAVKNVGKSVVGRFKGLLGIGSPSKVFAGFGVNINEGLLLGLKKSEGLLRTGTRAQASTLTNSFRPPTGAARPADVRRGGAGGQIHVEVHNPKPERASESVPRAVQRATRNAGWAAA